MTIPLDKQMHFMAGVLIVVVVFLLSGSSVLGVSVAAIAGYIKEVYDEEHPTKHTADSMDFFATVLGAVVAGLATLFFRS